MKIFSGSANKPLAEKIAHSLGLSVSPLEIHIFPDGEKRVRVLEKVLDEDCVVIQPTAPLVDANYMELFFIVDALKRSGAKSVTTVIPYLGYQRQDHVFREGEAVSFSVIVKELEAIGVDKVITFDLHTIRALEVFKIPVVHLSVLSLFGEKIKEFFRGPVTLAGPAAYSSQGAPASLSAQGRSANADARLGSPLLASPAAGATPHDFVLISPDMGGIRRVKLLSEMLSGMSYAAVVKNRDLATGQITISDIRGNVGKTVIIIDDMIASGSTIVSAAAALRERGVERIFVFATHPVFTADAPRVLQESEVEKVFVTDTIFVPHEKRFDKLEVLSVGGIIAKQLEILSTKS